MLRSVHMATVLVIIVVVTFTVNVKGDESPVQEIPGTEVKCTPCQQLPPPPPPPPLPACPPPPSPPPPKTPTQNSPPPPPPPFYYITTTQPGNLYPFDDYSGGVINDHCSVMISVVVGFCVVIGVFGYMGL